MLFQRIRYRPRTSEQFNLSHTPHIFRKGARHLCGRLRHLHHYCFYLVAAEHQHLKKEARDNCSYDSRS